MIDHAGALSRFLPGLDTRHTLIILEAEGRFVAFGDFITVRIDHVEGGEHLHRVIMPARGTFSQLIFFFSNFAIILCSQDSLEFHLNSFSVVIYDILHLYVQRKL